MQDSSASGSSGIEKRPVADGLISSSPASCVIVIFAVLNAGAEILNPALRPSPVLFSVTVTVITSEQLPVVLSMENQSPLSVIVTVHCSAFVSTVIVCEDASFVK